MQNDPYYEYIVLANHYESDELSITSIKETIDFWEGPGLKIIFFTGMPEFSNFERGILFAKDVEPNNEMADYSAREELVKYLHSRGVTVVNRKDIFCSLTENCSYRTDSDDLLLVDKEHLSRLGARMFGNALMPKIIIELEDETE